MLVQLIPSTGEALEALELADHPRQGDTLELAGGDHAGVVWRVTRVHWTLAGNSSPGPCAAVRLHLARLGYNVSDPHAA